MTDSSRKSLLPRKLSARATLIVVGLLIAYVLLQPKLEGWFGVDLPSLVDEPGEVAVSDDPAERSSDATSPVPERSESATQDDVRKSTAPPGTSPLGELRETGRRVFVSTAGLKYRPGSQEGHRIDHVLRHAEDDPSRPVHGVFDGDRDKIFAVIDEAYLMTQERGPPAVASERDDGRTIWTVDLGRRIGFVGGQSGRRRNHPASHHLKLVLENGTNVVTAYPVRVTGR